MLCGGFFSGAEKFEEQFFFPAEKRCELCVVLVQKSELQQQFFAAGKWRPDNLFLGYTFTERFSYSDKIQRTVFG